MIELTSSVSLKLLNYCRGYPTVKMSNKRKDLSLTDSLIFSSKIKEA